MDKVEELMKGTPVDGTVARLFEGTTRAYIRCVDVAYESSRDETFHDIQLDVKGCKTIHDRCTLQITTLVRHDDDFF
jgi:ubiquitin carboxyl-terminal hydrolase 7